MSAWRVKARIARRYLSHPRWGLAYWRGRHGSLADPRADVSLLERARFSGPADAALAELCGRPRELCAEALAGAVLPVSIDNDWPTWWPRELLMRLLAALVFLEQPRTVVEIGVARGYSSAAILQALAASADRDGRLFSIDLPPAAEETGFVGAVVPDELRHRWQLALGPSRAELAPLLERLGSCDLFVHDGDHSYESQREDLEVAWPRLRPGGVAVVDDIWTPAVFDFAASRAAPVVLARGELEHDAIAMVRKPGAGPAPPSPAEAR